jgi:hypothetical protein
MSKLPETIQPTVGLEIGGKTRKLAFDFNAICVVTELTSIDLLESSLMRWTPPVARALLFASLLHDDPTLTLEEAGSWVTINNLGNIRPAIEAAWFGSFGTTDTEDESLGEAQAQPQSNG